MSSGAGAQNPGPAAPAPRGAEGHSPEFKTWLSGVGSFAEFGIAAEAQGAPQPPPQGPGQTHVGAADPLQQEPGHLRLAVELGLSEPQLVFCLQNGTGCARQPRHGPLLPSSAFSRQRNTLLLVLHPPPFWHRDKGAWWDPHAPLTPSSRHRAPWAGLPEGSGCIETGFLLDPTVLTAAQGTAARD